MSSEIPRLSEGLADRYRIERELGAGGMATVDLAWEVAPLRGFRRSERRPQRRHHLGGVQQVFVQSFPDGRNKRVASRGRGFEPRWARSGKELFFESVGRLMVVDVGSGDDIEIGEPLALFSLAGYRRARNARSSTWRRATSGS